MGYCCWVVGELGLGLEGLVPVLLEFVLLELELVLLDDPEVLPLEGWPRPAALPPLMVCASEMGS